MESLAFTRGIKATAILLLMIGCLALALDGLHYTHPYPDSTALYEVPADLSRQIVMPIWVGIGALMLGAVLLMIPMNSKNMDVLSS
jgi:hypothetical protein